MGLSGSVNYTVASGSYSPGTMLIQEKRLPGSGMVKDFNLFEKPSTTTVEELTIKYFQRVYDDGTAGYCYYTKTTIDPTPSAGETTPNYTGTISDHSVVKILEIY